MDPVDYTPMTTSQTDAFLEAVMATIEAQPPDLRERLFLAIKSGLYDVVSASPERLVLDIRGHGELVVHAVNLPARLDA